MQYRSEEIPPGGPLGGQGPRVQISSLCLPLLIETPGSWPPGEHPRVHSTFLLQNNDSYRQNSSLQIIFFYLSLF